jgi:hypothetical protein
MMIKKSAALGLLLLPLVACAKEDPPAVHFPDLATLPPFTTTAPVPPGTAEVVSQRWDKALRYTEATAVCAVKVTNTTDRVVPMIKADVVFESGGTKYNTWTLGVDNLMPGQSQTKDAFSYHSSGDASVPPGTDFTCRIARVFE